MNPYAKKPSRPNGMSAVDYHRWLYGEDSGYPTNTSPGYAFCAALAIKIFGSNSKVKKTVKKLTEEQK